jgi:hypothetical protein
MSISPFYVQHRSGASRLERSPTAPSVGQCIVHTSFPFALDLRSMSRIALVRSVGGILLTMVTLSLFWCGELSCLQGHNDDDCQTLLCVLANRSAAAAPRAQVPAHQCCCTLSHTTGLPIQSDEVLIVEATRLMICAPSDEIAEPPQRTLLRPPSV